MKTIFSRNIKYSDSLVGAGLEDLCRQATNKSLPVPDAEANSQVIFYFYYFNQDSVGCPFPSTRTFFSSIFSRFHLFVNPIYLLK